MASGFGITGTIKGLPETLAALKSLPGKMQRQILRPALSKATKPVFMHARKNAAKDSGLLRKSITRKVVTYKSGTLVVVIGPDTKHRKEVVRKGSYSKKPQIANPAMYAHLVEFGTRPHSLAKGDRLERTGEMAQKADARSVANVKRWRAEVNEIGVLPQTAKAQMRRSKLLDRIHRHLQRTVARRTTIKTEGAAMHPGATARPFLRPAFDMTRTQTETIFADEVRKNIEKIAAKKGIAI